MQINEKKKHRYKVQEKKDAFSTVKTRGEETEPKEGWLFMEQKGSHFSQTL
jgi:hypothetical protein